MKEKKKITPQEAKTDSIVKNINYKITKAAMAGDREQVKKLKTELVNIDKKVSPKKKK